MRVRTTILLLLLFTGTAFIAGLEQVRRAEAQKFNGAKAALEKSWRASVDDFWRNQGASLQKMVDDLPSGVDVLATILDKSIKSAQELWDDRTLASFGANGVWVYNRDGTLFYFHANTHVEELQNSTLAPDAVGKLLPAKASPPFYISLPARADGGLRLLELRAVPVRPQWDKRQQEAPQALFVAGRILDDEILGAALAPGNDHVHFLPPEETSLPARGAGEMQYLLPPLRDWRGREVARVVFTNDNPAMAGLEARGNRIFISLLLATVVLFAILLLFLERGLVQPLQRVIGTLHSENLLLLEPLRRQKAEFGELARLIQTFFKQRADLVREMEERGAAEKALHESEERLRHSQKLEAVGRLAGGVAHDFNNLLTAIIGYADLLRQRLAGNAEVCQPAELIHEAGERAAGLTRQLLAFSRKQLLQPRVIDLNVIINNLHRLLQRIIGEHIEIIAQPHAIHPRVNADPGQIEQVIVNLGVNARDAMPRGGRLLIVTRDIVLDDTSHVPDLPLGAYVALEVTDTGEGMDDQTKARIFEPFFTTKGPGKGTGLGLATVYGVIKQSHGAIVVESERGRGTTFRIFLPREDAPVDLITAPVVPMKISARGERILVVEDEPIVRELVCEVLKSHGYDVLSTDRGTEALRLLQNGAAALDLLISDVIMPEMNGSIVALRVREVCPRARVLFVSGYSENDMADQGLGTLAYQVLQKPFTPDALARKVREVLDQN